MGKVYKCDLLTVTENIEVDRDASKRTNIRNAETRVAKTVMVERTLNGFKELITGKKIPEYSIYTHKIDKDYPGEVTHFVPKKPYFIKFHEEELVDRYQGNDLQLATAEELEDYVGENMPGGEITHFSEELDKIFETAEFYYSAAEKSKIYGNKTRIRTVKRYIRDSKR